MQDIKVSAACFEKVAVGEMWRTTANYNSMKMPLNICGSSHLIKINIVFHFD